MTTIYPTHTCFDDAFEFIEFKLNSEPAALHKMTLVHAIVLRPDPPDEGEPFAHAWVEYEGCCWFSGLIDNQKVFVGAPLAEYHVKMRPQAMTRYSMGQASIMNRTRGTFGPWESRYRALCRDASNDAT